MDAFLCSECHWFGYPDRTVTDHDDGTATVVLACRQCGKVLQSYGTTGKPVGEKREPERV